MEDLKPNNTELEFLTLAYNRFYDLYDEVMDDDYWQKDEWERFSKIKQAFAIYAELLNYEPIKHVIEQLKTARPPMESEIGSELFKFVRNVVSHFPFFNSWDAVWVSKPIINWYREGLTIDRFLKKYEGHQEVNWAKLGANDSIVHMRQLPPRGKKAPTIQMNDDTFYSIVITEAVDGKVKFSIPETDVYMAVQVVNEGGHGQHYVVEDGDYELPVESDFAFLIYRTGLENGFEAAHIAQDKIKTDMMNFGTYIIANYDFEEVEEWTSRLTAETAGSVFKYTFPRTSGEITDRHQWNLENANGWGGSSPEVNVANKYTNSIQLDGKKSYSVTFNNPESRFFTSVTVYDKERYLMEGVNNINSYPWKENKDGTITINFNAGKDAINNIDTKGEDFSFTMRYYGVSQKVMDGEIAPEQNVQEIK